ncbi:hypothetical protein QBC40DRAFT_327552 [Triangularia verruculosa]|uniref:AA1-like domain-containing protein n=1 Tax=Triangularia verruculosa TaxID=2587418 RepID=A0AAN6XG76_9PEZI|nr:hypothetical protein QBC40DRAFT_327552 [Triangularia verruculosa]
MTPPILLPILLFTSLTLTSPLLPRGDSSCSHSSLSGFNWTAKSLHFHSLTTLTSPTTFSSASGSLSFNLSNPALGPSFDQLCTATSPTPDQFFYLDQWFTCLYTPSPSGSNLDPLVATTSAASFRFDKPSGRLEVRQSWECGDGDDPQYPTAQFSASGGVNVSLDCRMDFWQNPNWAGGSGDLLYGNETVECGVVDVQVAVESIEASA